MIRVRVYDDRRTQAKGMYDDPRANEGRRGVVNEVRTDKTYGDRSEKRKSHNITPLLGSKLGATTQGESVEGELGG